MLKFKITAALIAAAAVGLGAVRSSSAVVITQYSFSATSPTPSTTELATSGTGTATALGMTNSYTYSNGEGPGSSDGSNIANTSGTAISSFSEYMFRIVGNSNAKNAGAGKADGWNNSAPDYSQGAEFGANATGFQPTSLSFDWYCTTQGVANLQVRYTLDGSTWTNLGSDYVATPNDFYGANSSTSTANVPITLDLSSISGAVNNPLFAVEMVSVRPVAGDSDYFATGPGHDGAYASASTTAAAPTDYNNNSGNWRFDNVTISGTAVPEPTTGALLGLASLGLLVRGRRRNA